MVLHITDNSRVLQYAWHSCYALVFGVEVQCGSLVFAYFTP
nr:DUF3265 domain-containing protein [Vibrio owensii]